MLNPPSQHGHILQHQAWGQLKSQFGWQPVQLQTGQARVQILFRSLPFGLFTLGYVPRGPIVDWGNWAARQEILTLMHLEAKRRRAIFLKLEPDVWQPDETVTPFLQKWGFIEADTIQPPSTIIVDLRGSEEEILAAMKQKTRYNIRLAEKKGVTIRLGRFEELTIFYKLAQVTAQRDGFGIHSLAYYQAAYRLFKKQCALLLAEVMGQVVAAVMIFYQGDTAYYFYGASGNEHRQLMPTYLIQWEAMRWAKAQGCYYYDLWGIPTADLATLEAQFEQRHDGLWGVYRFKRGFGGAVQQTIGAFDYIYQPWLYRLYQWWRNRKTMVTSEK